MTHAKSTRVTINTKEKGA